MIFFHSFIAGNFHGDVHKVIQNFFRQIGLRVMMALAACDGGAHVAVRVGRGRGGVGQGTAGLDGVVVRHVQL